MGGLSGNIVWQFRRERTEGTGGILTVPSYSDSERTSWEEEIGRGWRGKKMATEPAARRGSCVTRSPNAIASVSAVGRNVFWTLSLWRSLRSGTEPRHLVLQHLSKEPLFVWCESQKSGNRFDEVYRLEWEKSFRHHTEGDDGGGWLKTFHVVLSGNIWFHSTKGRKGIRARSCWADAVMIALTWTW